MTILVSDFRAEHVFVASQSDGIADKNFGMVLVRMPVAFGRIDHVQAIIQSLVEQPRHALLLGTGQPYGQATETYDRYLKIGPSETTIFDAIPRVSECWHAGYE